MENATVDASIYCSACRKFFSLNKSCGHSVKNKMVSCNICKAQLEATRMKEHICFHISDREASHFRKPIRKRSSARLNKPPSSTSVCAGDDDVKPDIAVEIDICIYCSKEIPLSMLEEHENAHREEERHRAKQHRVHVPKEGDTMCTICGASVSCKDLKKHERTHRRLGTVICSICGFPAKNIYQHMATHSEERRYSCQECGLAFKHKKNLDAHMLVHEAVGKHKCPTCEKAFKTPYNLRVHLRSHQEVKPFACQYCDKTFTTKQSRDNHMKTHIANNL